MRYEDHRKKCPVCKEYRIIGDLDAYVFQRDVKEGKVTKRLYFCGWNCMRAWEASRKKERKAEE